MPRGRVTNHFRHIAKLLCLCAAISLSGCLESDEPVTIQLSDLLRIEGLNSVWQFDSEKKQYLQLVLQKDRHYKYSLIGLENGVVGKAALYDLAFIPLSVQEPGVEHYLAIAKHLDEKEPDKFTYSYAEFRRTQNQFSWRLPDMVDDEGLIKAATAIAGAKGISINGARSSFTTLQGSLNSSTLRALFSDRAFRQALKGKYKPLEPISDAEKRELIAAGLDLANEATAERAGPGSTVASLVDELRKKVTSNGPFDQALFEQTAAALRASDQQSPVTQELQANAWDFVEGKVRASMFAAYLKETLSSITAANARARESLKLLQEKSASGDLWAKFFLARAHFHAASQFRQAQQTERFEGLALPVTARPYWDAYQQLLRDPTFEGSPAECQRLADEGLQKSFAPLINIKGVSKLLGLGMTKDEAEGIRLTRQAADRGFGIAMYGLAIAYASGEGLSKDPSEANTWWRKAAELGHAGAMYELGLSYEAGRGVEQNMSEAARWFLKAADLGNVDAMAALGDIYATGRGATKDEAQAVQWYRKAADQGNTHAMFRLGVAYSQGHGVIKDEIQAVKWYRKAAEEGNPDAQVKLALLLGDGIGVPKDTEEAMRLFRQAAEQKHRRAQFYLGYAYESGIGVSESDSEAAKWYRLAADQKDADAQYRLAMLIGGGKGVPKDLGEAVRLLKLAADQGNSDAQFRLGRLYDSGTGVTQSAIDAVKFYQLAAQGQHAHAQYRLGLALANGEGIDRNLPEAARWYRAAADQNHSDAALRLGLMLINGHGVQASPLEGFKLIKTAADDNPDALFVLAMLYGSGTGTTRDPAQAEKLTSTANEKGSEAARAVLGLLDPESVKTSTLDILLELFGQVRFPSSEAGSPNFVRAETATFFEKFPMTMPVDLIGRVYSRQGAVVITYTSNGSPCSQLQEHQVSWAYSETRSIEKRDGFTGVLDLRLRIDQLSPVIQKGSVALASSFKLKNFKPEPFGETHFPVTAVYIKGTQYEPMSVLQYSDKKGDYKWDVWVALVQKRLANGIKKLGLYSSVDEEKPVPTDVKQRLSDLNNQINSRVRSLHLLSECAGYAAQIAQGKMDEISRQMRKEEKFISDADEILKEGFGVRQNDRGELEFIDRRMEAVVKFYETKTGRKVNRVDRPQVEQALQALKTMQLTESEREILKQAFARK